MERETNRKCETQKGIKRETKAQEEGNDWKRKFKMGREEERKEGGQERIRGSKYERLRDTILENSL